MDDDGIIIDALYGVANSYLKNYLFTNDRGGFITFLTEVRYIFLKERENSYPPEFTWELMKKYDGGRSIFLY